MSTAQVIQLHPEPQTKTTRKKSRRSFGSVRKLSSGRYQARYVGPDQVMRSAPVTFDTKADAGAWLAKKQTEITNQVWRPPAPRTQTTLANYAEEWLKTHRGRDGKPLKPKTLDDYTRWLDRLILPELGGRRLDLITPEVVASWYAGLCPTAPTQRARVYSLLQTILKGALPVNPCQVEGAGSAKTVRKITPATPAELKALMEAVPEHYRAAILLGGWCAIRYGELTELRRKDFNLARGIFTVARGVTWVRESRGSSVYVPVVGPPKSEAGVRDLEIPPHILPVVQHHLDSFVAADPEALVFPSRTGSHLRYSSFTKVFYRARKVAGREDLSIHQLRHTGATLSAQAGATLKELMEKLGQSSPAMALRYQHVAAGRQKALAAKLSEMAEAGL